MKQLILIRHGQAIPHESGVRDFARQLEQEGKDEARMAGRFLHTKSDWKPDRLLASPAARALATARLVARELGIDETDLRKDRSIYEAEISDLLAVMHGIEDSIQTACLVGHNPGMENLANALAGDRIVSNLTTAGVVMLELNVDDWSEVKQNCATLHRYATPAEIRENGSIP